MSVDIAPDLAKLPDLGFGQELYASDDDLYPTALLFAAVKTKMISGQYPYTGTGNKQFEGEVSPEEVIPTGAVAIRAHIRYDKGMVLQCEGPDFDVIIDLSKTYAAFTVAAGSSETVERVLTEAIGSLPGPPNKDPGAVQYRIWNLRPTGPNYTWKTIHCDAWGDISRNYSPRVSPSLDRLMQVTAEQVDGSGKLILWHGPPGTGKTTAIRSLTREWRDWCEPHYITDPERMFSDPGYLLHVAGSGNEDKWALFIAEDSDEFLRADAREASGAALGRLLNFSDGILGQGTNTLILLTTNEDLGELHPAVTRPGRCLAKLEFDKFTTAEAAAWLGQPYSGMSLSLAELIEKGAAARIATPEGKDESTGLYL